MPSQTKVLIDNLKLTALAILVAAVTGWIVSGVVNFAWNQEAFRYRNAGGSIDTRRLEEYDRTKRSIIFFFMGASAIAAQVVFVLTYKKTSKESAEAIAAPTEPEPNERNA